MVGLFAWAADVVGAGQSDEEGDGERDPLVFTPEQQNHVWELNQKAKLLSRSIQDLRLRIPPPDISQRLPHIHAHSIASNAALALQLNSHSATKEQAQFREITLQEENDAFGDAISDCDNKIREKLAEADLLQRKLEELDTIGKNLIVELENAHKTQSARTSASMVESEEVDACTNNTEALKPDISDKLEGLKKELCSLEEVVENSEKIWAQVQESSLKQPTIAQREKLLDKQLHSLMEQLAAKQSQREGLVREVHAKEMELERLNRARLERTRFGRIENLKGSASSGYIAGSHQKQPPYHQKRAMLLRLAFVLYILSLHGLVFLKISL